MSKELEDFSDQIAELFDQEPDEPGNFEVPAAQLFIRKKDMITLIVATDFSPLAENAVDYAAALARHYQARLVLFNAFTIPVAVANGMLSAADLDALLLDNANRLSDRAEKAAQNYGITVHYESSYSVIPDELENLLAKYQAELVVLGMEPDSLIQDIFGNTTTALIRRLNCPILAVPKGAHFEGLKKILFACDLAHTLPAGILAKIKAMAVAFQAELEIFFVQESGGETLTASDAIGAELEGVPYTFKTIHSNAVTGAIRQEIDSSDADLLIMAPKTYDFWPSMVHRSKTRKMAAGLDIPLLAIHN